MSVLVTGATGFLGNLVIEQLLNDGIEVVATSRSKEKAQLFQWYSKVTYIPFDINSTTHFQGNLFHHFHSPTQLIHLAWEGLPNYNALSHFETNLYSSYYFLKRLIGEGLSDLTITGTCLEYGMQEGCLSETTPTNPSNPYAIAKDTLCKMLQTISLSNTINLKWLRLFYMYGKGQAPTSLFSQLETAIARNDNTFNMSGGEQTRDFLPVEKVVEIIVQLTFLNTNAGVVNCCSGKPQKVKDFVTQMINERSSSIKLNLGYYPYTSYEPMCFWGDTTKLNTLLLSR